MTATPTLVHLYGGPLDGTDTDPPADSSGRIVARNVDGPKNAPPAIYVPCSLTSERLGKTCFRHTLTRPPGSK